MGNIQTAKISTQGEWLTRDGKSWIVRVPTSGGHKKFPFDEYGGSSKALKVARAFHVAMVQQLKKDREYYKKHGEKFQRVRSNNTSGINGVTRMVFPRLEGFPNIVFRAYYTNRNKGIWKSKDFSTYHYITEKNAKDAASKQRKQWERQYG